MNERLTHKTIARRRRTAAFLVIALGMAVTVPVFGAPDARTIMEGVYAQDTSRDMTMRAVLEIFDKTGQGKKKKFILQRIGSPGQSKTLLRFTDPEEIRGVALLSFNTKGATERQWLYTPAIDRVRSIQPREQSERFAGSDFTYEDIAERGLDDFTYRIIGEGETMEGHKTFKIEAAPVSTDISQYRFIYFWVAQDVPVVLGAEMYDQGGRKVRVMHATTLKKASGVWGMRHVEMASVLENTRSIFTIDEVHFNTGLSEKLFTPEALQGAKAQKQIP